MVEPTFQHRSTASLLLGPGRRFLVEQGDVIGTSVGGWQVGGLVPIASGPPLSVTCATNSTQSLGGEAARILRDPSLPADARTIDHFFNTNGSSSPDPVTFGNAGRSIPSLRGDATKNVNLSLFKTTSLGNRTRLEIRGEFSNISNLPQCASPNTSFGTVRFGTASSQANLQRDIQPGVKLYF